MEYMKKLLGVQLEVFNLINVFPQKFLSGNSFQKLTFYILFLLQKFQIL